MRALCLCRPSTEASVGLVAAADTTECCPRESAIVEADLSLFPKVLDHDLPVLIVPVLDIRCHILCWSLVGPGCSECPVRGRQTGGRVALLALSADAHDGRLVVTCDAARTNVVVEV